MRNVLSPVISISLFSALLSGCIGEQLCDLSAAASVRVTVVDGAGVPETNATVTFSVDGGSEEPASCMEPADVDDASAGCKAWVTGFERAGRFVIKAVSADGARAAQTEVTVAKGECHVVSEAAKLTLSGVGEPLCAEQHQAKTTDGFDVTVCDKAFDTAPFIHLPRVDAQTGSDGERVVFAALRSQTELVTAEGDVLGVSLDDEAMNAEMDRQGLAIYRVTLDDRGAVSAVAPFVLVDERVLLAPFIGRAFEGVISRRLPADASGISSWEFTPSIPVRLRAEAVEETSGKLTTLADGVKAYGLRLVVESLDASVLASDGRCIASLRSHAAEDPFAGIREVVLKAERVPSMHGFGDNEFDVEFIGDGMSMGSDMDAAWYLGPEAAFGATPEITTTYEGVGHGTPGSLPNLTIKIVGDSGGGACTAAP